jgi:hypothetical protein
MSDSANPTKSKQSVFDKLFGEYTFPDSSCACDNSPEKRTSSYEVKDNRFYILEPAAQFYRRLDCFQNVRDVVQRTVSYLDGDWVGPKHVATMKDAGANPELLAVYFGNAWPTAPLDDEPGRLALSMVAIDAAAKKIKANKRELELRQEALDFVEDELSHISGINHEGKPSTMADYMEAGWYDELRKEVKEYLEFFARGGEYDKKFKQFVKWNEPYWEMMKNDARTMLPVSVAEFFIEQGDPQYALDLISPSKSRVALRKLDHYLKELEKVQASASPERMARAMRASLIGKYFLRATAGPVQKVRKGAPQGAAQLPLPVRRLRNWFVEAGNRAGIRPYWQGMPLNPRQCSDWIYIQGKVAGCSHGHGKHTFPQGVANVTVTFINKDQYEWIKLANEMGVKLTTDDDPPGFSKEQMPHDLDPVLHAYSLKYQLEDVAGKVEGILSELFHHAHKQPLGFRF